MKTMKQREKITYTDERRYWIVTSEDEVKTGDHLLDHIGQHNPGTPVVVTEVTESTITVDTGMVYVRSGGWEEGDEKKLRRLYILRLPRTVEVWTDTVV